MNLKNKRIRLIAAVGAGVMLAFSASAAPASAAPAFAEPNPCAGHNSDEGTGDEYGPDHDITIYGTWYNCGNTAGTDRVKIDVAGSTDGPCISVPYGSNGSSVFHRSPYIITGPGPRFAGWKRC